MFGELDEGKKWHTAVVLHLDYTPLRAVPSALEDLDPLGLASRNTLFIVS